MIRNKLTGAYYIGGTVTSFSRRFASHHSALRGGYGSPLLQAAWDATGEPEHWFEFVPLYTCPPEEVRPRETEAIEKLRPILNQVGVPGSRGVTSEVSIAALRAGVTPDAVRYRKKVGIPLDRPKGVRVLVGDVAMSLADAAEALNLTVEGVRSRIKRGLLVRA